MSNNTASIKNGLITEGGGSKTLGHFEVRYGAMGVSVVGTAAPNRTLGNIGTGGRSMARCCARFPSFGQRKQLPTNVAPKRVLRTSVPPTLCQWFAALVTAWIPSARCVWWPARHRRHVQGGPSADNWPRNTEWIRTRTPTNGANCGVQLIVSVRWAGEEARTGRHMW
ncbi:hypothetical protein niasHS_013951 [Heterodera schachtii]|uniref:Uncharacterized protein n=2 Tax=Heterodera TaxID=34509 RepID=A0ABD2IHP6_HETSC